MGGTDVDRSVHTEIQGWGQPLDKGRQVAKPQVILAPKIFGTLSAEVAFDCALLIIQAQIIDRIRLRGAIQGT
ncbi:hypothetical protein D3C75_1325700 [compost metagenome]